MTASNARTRPKTKLWIGVGSAISLAVVAALLLRPRHAPPRPAPITSANPSKAPVFVRFETPTPKVKIHPIGEGFEVINTDPQLTGTQLDFAGVTNTGQRIPYSVKLPPPVASTAASGG